MPMLFHWYIFLVLSYSLIEQGRILMINKQSLWFLTLFSLILVLSVYYITMPNELLLTNNNQYSDKSETEDKNNESEETEENAKVTIEESDLLVAMRVSLEEERLNLMNDLQEQLTNSETTVEEKNNAYEQLRYLNQIQGDEEKLEAKIKKNFQLDSFIQIDNNQIKVVVVSKEHDNKLANNIMRSIQEEYQEKMYITVKFEE